MNIRPVNSADAEAFSILRREVTRLNPVQMGLSYEEELSRNVDSFREQLVFSHPNTMFGCFIEDKLVSTAAVGYTSRFPSSRHKMVMWGVFTSPEYRRRGLSRRAVESAVAHAFSNNVLRINLQVYVPNEPAIGLYKSIGFVEYGVEPQALYLDGKFHDGVHMTLTQKQALI